MVLALVILLFPHPARTPAAKLEFYAATHLFNLTGGFERPTDVAVSPQGRIYVVDGVNHRVAVFNESGKRVATLGGRGRMSSPLGVGVGESGTVYVADSGNHRVQIYSSSGSLVGKVSVPHGKKSSDPSDVLVNEAKDRFYVVDNDNHRILAYSASGRAKVGQFGGPGRGRRQFRYPFMIDKDQDGYLYVSDVINTRVQVLDPTGKFVSNVGGWGVNVGKFFRPKGVAVDQQNRVFVSDSYLGVIQVFGTYGDIRGVIGDPERRVPMRFKTPTGIAVDHNNRLYVVEMDRNRVSVYQLEGGA